MSDSKDPIGTPPDIIATDVADEHKFQSGSDISDDAIKNLMFYLRCMGWTDDEIQRRTSTIVVTHAVVGGNLNHVAQVIVTYYMLSREIDEHTH